MERALATVNLHGTLNPGKITENLMYQSILVRVSSSSLLPCEPRHVRACITSRVRNAKYATHFIFSTLTLRLVICRSFPYPPPSRRWNNLSEMGNSLRLMDGWSNCWYNTVHSIVFFSVTSHSSTIARMAQAERCTPSAASHVFWRNTPDRLTIW